MSEKPEWAMEKARSLYDALETTLEYYARTVAERLDIDAIALAIMEAEARGRLAGLEEAAKVAANWLSDWGIDLGETSNEYFHAATTGVHNGRKIKEDWAKNFGRQFKERSDAVYGCAEPLATAIRALKEKQP